MRAKTLIAGLLLLCAVPFFSLRAQEKVFANEVILGVGDPLSECLYYRADPHQDYSFYNPDVTYLEKQNYRHVPHFYLEYYRNLLPWLAVGAQVDVGSFYWTNVYYRGGSNTPVESCRQKNFNISILPAVRFAYMRKDHVRLYSALRPGLTINTGSEMDYKGRYTAAGFGIDITWIGVSYMSGPWFGSFELGLMAALGDVNSIFMAGSKLMSLSFGYRF